MSFFNNLFTGRTNKKATLPPLDMSAVKLDMHSHLIPGIDDGAPDMQTSLGLIQDLMEFGYTHLVTTPHIHSDIYPNKAEVIIQGRDAVRQALQDAGIHVTFDAAAEYFCDEIFMKLIQNKELLTFYGNHVLFELSFDSEPYFYKQAVFDMQINGYQPILAHPERYPYWHDKFSMYEDAVDRGILLQLNINSLSGQYGPGVKKASEKLIDAGLISFLGTDTHHQGHVNLWKNAAMHEHLRKLVESGNLRNPQLAG